MAHRDQKPGIRGIHLVKECCACGATSCMLSNGECVINKGVSILLCGGRGSNLGEKGSKDLSNCKVNAFTDGVSLGIADARVNVGNLGFHERHLEVMASEFWAIVLWALGGTGTSAKPVVMEEMPGGS